MDTFDTLLLWWFRGDEVARAIGITDDFRWPDLVLVVAIVAALVVWGVYLDAPKLQRSKTLRASSWATVCFAVLGLWGLWGVPLASLQRAERLRAALEEPDVQVHFVPGTVRIGARFSADRFYGVTDSVITPRLIVDIPHSRATRIEGALRSEGVQVALGDESTTNP